MRKQIVAGNWKMNLSVAAGHSLIEEVLAGLPELKAHCQVVFAPPFLHLTDAVQQVAGKSQVYVSAQNAHQERAGAYTGEVSAEMLRASGVSHVILGHSERREYAQESNALLAQKTDAALAQGLEVIFCCGEALEVRDAGTQNAWVTQQLRESLFHLDAAQLTHVVIAYEPIWAIGTGRTASAAQAQEMHAHIRSVLSAQYGAAVADATPILYGGSCKPSNAAELFAGADVDGGLIGGASLQAADFLGIITAMAEKK